MPECDFNKVAKQSRTPKPKRDFNNVALQLYCNHTPA